MKMKTLMPFGFIFVLLLILCAVPMAAAFSNSLAGLTTADLGCCCTCVVDVRYYGAVPNDDKDDSEAIKNALAVATSGASKRLYFPCGNYRVVTQYGETFSLSNNIVVEGDGPGLTTITAINETGVEPFDWNLFEIVEEDSATVKDLTLVGNGLISGPGEGGYHTAVVHRGGTSGIMMIQNVVTHGFSQAFKKDPGDVSVTIRDSDVSALAIGYLSANGPATGSGGRSLISRTRFHDIGTSTDPNKRHGLYITAPFIELLVENCIFENITGYGIHRYNCEPCAGVSSGSVIITGNRFVNTIDGMGHGGITLEGMINYDVVISGNSFELAQPGSNAYGVEVYTNNVVITGNSFTVRNAGVLAGAQSANGTVSGNRFRLVGNEPEGGVYGVFVYGTGWNISGNTFVGVSGKPYCVRLMGAKHTNIASNTFHLNGGPGVYVDFSDPPVDDPETALVITDKIQIAGNQFFGYSGGYGGVFITAPGETTPFINNARIVGNTFQNTGSYSIYSQRPGVVAESNEAIAQVSIQVPVLASAPELELPVGSGPWHVTGTETISTLNPPTIGFRGMITLIADGAWSFDTSGESKIRASEAPMTAGLAVTLIYDGSFWYEVGRGTP